MSVQSASQPQHRKILIAFVTLASVAIVYCYLNITAMWASATTALPTYDQVTYLENTIQIGYRIDKNPWQALNPMVYLNTPAPNRPPLMSAIAAWVYGLKIDSQSVAMLWLFCRVFGLVAVLVLIAWRAGRYMWIPPALMAILCAPGWLKIYPNMLMVDEAFEVGVLLAFACAAWDLYRPGWRAAMAAVAGFFVAILIKPAALILFLPWFAVLLWQMVRCRMNRARMIVYLAGLAALIFLACSPYGPAVVQQYMLGMKGYWAIPMAWHIKAALVLLLLPSWLLVWGLIQIIVKLCGRSGADDNSEKKEFFPMRTCGWYCKPMIIFGAWWVLFNYGITYTLDVRILPAIMPAVVVAACLWLFSNLRMAVIGTLVSACFFTGSMLVATGRLAPVWGLPWIEHQKPIAEVGLIPVIAGIKQSYRPGDQFLICIDDDFVENAALRFGFFHVPGEPHYIKINSAPWGVVNDLISPLLQFDLILLKQKRSTTNLVGDIWLTLHTIEDVIRMPESPLHAYYEPLWSLPVHQPDLEDEVTLYRRKGTVPPEIILQAQKFADMRIQQHMTRQ